MKFFKTKPEDTPSELDLELVEALQAVTDCAEANHVCGDAADNGRKVLERAKAELGLRD